MYLPPQSDSILFTFSGSYSPLPGWAVSFDYSTSQQGGGFAAAIISASSFLLYF